DKYAEGGLNCRMAPTDLPSANTSIQIGARMKSVAHYRGCGPSDELKALTELENKIDDIAGTEKWIR
ncbi:MAG TPA: hypothetical protein VK117_04060, partial [Pyrinomonadaceae bacterium]|nr:hypothetical protein [Pyrinomonadaceae bacterium]